MNFLLHFAFAEREIPNASEPNIVGLGAMLPDLWRMLERPLRARRPPEDGITTRRSTLNALLRGVHHHLDIDAWFHKSEVFREGERDLSKALLATKTPKLVLFAHPTWEMCLDGAYANREPGLNALLADAFRRAKDDLARTLRLSVDADALLQVDEDRLSERMRRIAIAAASGDLFDDYRSASGIARRMAGIRMAFGLPRPSEEEFRRWESAVLPFIERAADAIDGLFGERALALVDQTDLTR